MPNYVPSAPVTVAGQGQNPGCTAIVTAPNGVPAVLQGLQQNALNETGAMPGGGTTPVLKSFNATVTSSDGTTSVIVNPA